MPRTGTTTFTATRPNRLDYSEYVPDGFGTGDLVIVADGVLEVVDFKGVRPDRALLDVA